MYDSEDNYKRIMEEIDEGMPAYLEKCAELEQQFPNCPFEISCVHELSKLDEVFTLEPVIFIYDDRASPNNYYYSEMSDRERSKYVHYLKVEQKRNKPITLRQVIEAMANDAHYHDEVVMSDPHRFLESFDKCNKTGIQWSCFWGS